MWTANNEMSITYHNFYFHTVVYLEKGFILKEKFKILSLWVHPHVAPNCMTLCHSFEMTAVRILFHTIKHTLQTYCVFKQILLSRFYRPKNVIYTPVHHHRSGCNVPFGYNRSMHNDRFNCTWKKNNNPDDVHKSKHTILFTFRLFLHSVWLAYFDNTFKTGKQNINGHTLQ